MRTFFGSGSGSRIQCPASSNQPGLELRVSGQSLQAHSPAGRWALGPGSWNLTQYPFLLSLAAAAAALGGCILEEGPYHGPREVAVTRTYTSHGPVCPEIVASASVEPEEEATKRLSALASRPGLTAHEQVHLIDVAVDALPPGEAQAEVLEALAANPGLHADARMHLARRVRELPPGPDRTRVADALIAHPAPAK